MNDYSIEVATEVAAEQSGFRKRKKVGGIVVLASTFAIGMMLAASYKLRGLQPDIQHYLTISMILFVLGGIGVFVRRNAIVLFMCIELMLNAVNIAFVAFSRLHANIDGQIAVLFVMIVAAAEVAVGLAIMVSVFKARKSANVDDLKVLRW